MDLKAMLGAVAGALVGAIVWAVVVYYSGYEIGWIAWGIGGLAGYGASVLGGKGTSMGVFCAVMAVVGIAIGKLAAIEMVVADSLQTEIDMYLTQENYDLTLANAEAFKKVETDEDLYQYMIDREFTAATTPDQISMQEYQDFRAYAVPEIMRFAEAPPTFEQWRELEREIAMAQFSRAEAFQASLSPLDIIFVLLGVSTAWTLGRGRGEEEPLSVDTQEPPADAK